VGGGVRAHQGYLMLNALVSAAVNCIAIPAALLSFKLGGATSCNYYSSHFTYFALRNTLLL
jgi:hypothetical protein